jgi:hypothetical protein
MPKELTELSNFPPEEVSLVDKGANKKPRFPIVKELGMDQEILKAVLETPMDEETSLEEWVKKADLSDKGSSAVKGMIRILNGFRDELPEDVVSVLTKAAGFPVPEDEDEEKKKKKKKARPEEEEEMSEEKKVKKEETPSDVQPVENHDAVLKAYKTELDALKAQNEVVEKALKEERDQRVLASWVQKAKESLSYLTETPEELGATLKDLADVKKEMADKHFEQLKKASDAIKNSEIFEEKGLAGHGITKADSAWGKIEEIANGFVEKSDYEMTEAQAINKALFTEKGKKLYEQYLDENPAQTGARN